MKNFIIPVLVMSFSLRSTFQRHAILDSMAERIKDSRPASEMKFYEKFKVLMPLDLTMAGARHFIESSSKEHLAMDRDLS